MVTPGLKATRRTRVQAPAVGRTRAEIDHPHAGRGVAPARRACGSAARARASGPGQAIRRRGRAARPPASAPPRRPPGPAPRSAASARSSASGGTGATGPASSSAPPTASRPAARPARAVRAQRDVTRVGERVPVGRRAARVRDQGFVRGVVPRRRDHVGLRGHGSSPPSRIARRRASARRARCLHRAERQALPIGVLLQGLPVPVGALQHRRLLGRQRGDGAGQARALLGVSELLVGAHAGLGLPLGLGAERALELRLRVACVAHVIEEAVARDREEPRRGSPLARVELGRLAPDRQHHLLRQLVGDRRRGAPRDEVPFDLRRVEAESRSATAARSAPLPRWPRARPRRPRRRATSVAAASAPARPTAEGSERALAWSNASSNASPGASSKASSTPLRVTTCGTLARARPRGGPARRRGPAQSAMRRAVVTGLRSHYPHARAAWICEAPGRHSFE